MIPYGDMHKGSFECQQLQVSSIIRDVNYRWFSVSSNPTLYFIIPRFNVVQCKFWAFKCNHVWCVSFACLVCSCGSCGYELNLNSSNRNTGLIDSKSIKRGIISFFSVDESRFTQIHQLPWSFWIPFFNSKRQQRTKLLCRNCASHLGFAYTLPSQSQSWDGISDDSRIYDIKLTALLPSFSEEPTQRLEDMTKYESACSTVVF